MFRSLAPVLHRGNIAEMKTGEGKTLVATYAAYLNALTGRGVHIVTVNDYLATRDTDWMGQYLSVSRPTVGLIEAGQTPGRTPTRLRSRYHLRHEQRIRL